MPCYKPNAVIQISMMMVFSSMVQSQEIDFVEKYALATDREAILATLIPGTEDYFFYRTLHCQTVGRLSDAKGYLDAWISKLGETEKAREMRFRQMLLSYPDAPQATLDFLRRELALNLEHAAPRRDAVAQLPTQLAPETIDWDRRFHEAVTTGSRLQQIEDESLGDALPLIEYQPDIRAWVERVSRPDLPGLVDAIAQELQQPDSRGYGWAAIHRNLSLDQLDQLLKKLPKLIESDAFVQLYLMRLRPSDDATLVDKPTRREFLNRLEKFCDRLPESQNSLKAAVLYHRLKLDLAEGAIDRSRFIKYLALPRQAGYMNPERIRQIAARPSINFAQDFSASTSLTPIGDDSDLILKLLEHFFQSDQDSRAFSEYLDGDFLKRVFATTKILYGLGDSKAYYAQLTPEQQKEVQARVELRFSPTNPSHYGPNDRVQLALSIKNVPQLIVKLYRLNPKNILLAQSSNVSTSIDLDGMVANVERTIEYAQAADRRHSEVLDFPELAGRGVWIVDLLGGGQRSRALVQKGQLRSLQAISDAGHLFRIVDEQGEPVPSARVMLGEREFTPDKDGAIVVPFASAVESRSVVLADGNFASLEKFTHLAESYQLSAGFLVEPQSLRPGSRSAVVIRTELLCNDVPVSISLLESPQLTITATDRDGIQTSQTYHDLELSETLEFTQAFLVPQRLASLTFSLSGKVHNLSQAVRQSISATDSIELNGSSSTAQIGDFYLARLSTGFRLEVLGRNGEPMTQLPVQLQVKLLGIRQPVHLSLATDQQGIIELGPLPKVEKLLAIADDFQPREFIIDGSWLDWPSNLHLLQGQTIELAWPESEASVPHELQRFSLIEYRNGHVSTLLSKTLRVEHGKLLSEELQPGRYRLTDHRTEVSVDIEVVRGRDEEDYLIGRHQSLESNPPNGAYIAKTSLDQGRLMIQLDDHDDATRVHLLASSYDQSLDRIRSMRSVIPRLQRFDRIDPPSFYLDSMRLDEEYQYVLQRQLAKKFQGNMLPQPSVLLNPWELSVTSNETQVAQAGDAIASMAAAAPAPPPKSAEKKHAGQANTSIGSSSYDFLARGALVVSNLRPDDAGQVSIELSAIEGLTNIIAIAVHPNGTTYRRIALPLVEPRRLADNRLAKAFDPDRKLAERQRVLLLAAGEKNDLGEAASTRVRVYGSLAEVFALYSTYLKHHADFAKFNVLQAWPSLSDEEKQIQYALLACHEWNLFLYVHDTPFFDRVVKPYLVNKLEKQFIDDWLLGNDLNRYTVPWRLAQLNAMERALLARRLPNQLSPTSRWFRDNLELQPEHLNPSLRAMRFGTALLGESLYVDRHMMEDYALTPAAAAESESLAERSIAMNFDARGLGGALGRTRDEQSIHEKLGLAQNARGSDRKSPRLRRAMNRDGVESLYRPLEATRKWAETQYFHVLLSDQSPSLARANRFWRDYVDHTADKPFLSQHLDAPVQSLNEALMALAVMQLPIEAKPVEQTVENGRLLVSHPTASVAFVQSIETVDPAKEPASILVGQDIYLVAPADASQAKPIQNQPMLVNVPYRATVVLTNPSSNPQSVQVLTQIPQGAIPLSGGKTVRGTSLELGPYSSQQLSYEFYFPTAGSFNHYGAQVSNDSGHLASAASTTLIVLEKPESIDETTWAYVAAWGSNDQVHEFLKKANLQQLDLSTIAWRMQDRSFFDATLELLTQHGRFDSSLWAYAVKHNEERRLREWLETQPQVTNAIGPVFKSKLLNIEPVERFQYQHLDFRPLVVARIHQLGNKRLILNDGLAAHYHRFMHYLAFQSEIEPSQQLSIVYYLLIQNRIEEAIDRFDSIAQDAIEQNLQYDYFAVTFDLYRGRYREAAQRAAKYTDYLQPRWRDWFAQVRTHIADRDRLERGEPSLEFTTPDWQTDQQQRLLSGTRESSQMTAADQLPSLDLIDASGTLRAEYRNIQKLTVNYYLMDIELLFSRKPFAQHEGTRLSAIEPNQSEEIHLADGSKSHILAIPDKLKNQNLVMEVVGGGLTRSHTIYANSLLVALSTSMGRLQTLSASQRTPLAKAYVKVYARHQDGSIRFYKDGYTDLRGQFDYASLSTNESESAQRFSILVMHPDHGAIIREVDPPKK